MISDTRRGEKGAKPSIYARPSGKGRASSPERRPSQTVKRSKTHDVRNEYPKSRVVLGDSKIAKASTKQKNDLFAHSVNKAPSSSLRRSTMANSLQLPKLQRGQSQEEKVLAKEMLQKFKESSMQSSLDDRTRQASCAFCHEELPSRLPRLVKEALAQLVQKYGGRDKEAQMEQDVYTRTTFLIKKGNIPRKEQESFCHLHKIEITVKPEGRQKGYPSFIDFDQLKGRIHRMRNELEAVILGQEHSPYRNIALKAYETLGKNKARSTMGVMQRFDATLPGYYGPKGASIILRELQKLFINTNYLTKDMTKPQLPLEYMQQVLLPEVGYRLIKQDLTDRQSSNDGRDITQQAMDVMQESTEYGNMMYPDAHEPSAHEDKDDDDGDQDDQSEASFDSSAED